MWSPRFGPEPTAIPCPLGDGGRLQVHRSCRETRCQCDHCGRHFSLAELAPRLDDDAFSIVFAMVGDRPSDRV